MNERLKQLAEECTTIYDSTSIPVEKDFDYEKFAELLHRQVIASILITDVVMEAKGQVATSEDYIQAINKDFGVEE